MALSVLCFDFLVNLFSVLGDLFKSLLVYLKLLPHFYNVLECIIFRNRPIDASLGVLCLVVLITPAFPLPGVPPLWFLISQETTVGFLFLFLVIFIVGFRPQISVLFEAERLSAPGTQGAKLMRGSAPSATSHCGHHSVLSEPPPALIPTKGPTVPDQLAGPALSQMGVGPGPGSRPACCWVVPSGHAGGLVNLCMSVMDLLTQNRSPGPAPEQL